MPDTYKRSLKVLVVLYCIILVWPDPHKLCWNKVQYCSGRRRVYPIQKVTEIYKSEVAYIGTEPILP